MATINLYLIRHGQAQHNLYEEYFSSVAMKLLQERVGQGFVPELTPDEIKSFKADVTAAILNELGNIDERLIDPCLTATGKLQAQVVKAKLSGLKFDAVASSPLTRALETALLIQPTFKQDRQMMLADPAFREVSGGLRLSDKCTDYARKSRSLPMFRFADSIKPDELWASEREDEDSVAIRFSLGIKELLAKNPNGDDFAIVTHKGAITRFCKTHGIEIAAPGNCDIVLAKLNISQDVTKELELVSVDFYKKSSTLDDRLKACGSTRPVVSFDDPSNSVIIDEIHKLIDKLASAKSSIDKPRITSKM